MEAKNGARKWGPETGTGSGGQKWGQEVGARNGDRNLPAVQELLTQEVDFMAVIVDCCTAILEETHR